MLKGSFRLGGEIQEIIVRGDELLFFDISSGMITSIDGLNLSKSGCIKQFPDLENDNDWKKKTIERFKEKMKEYKTEMERMEYVQGELEKLGYEPLILQRAGFRTRRFK